MRDVVTHQAGNTRADSENNVDFNRTMLCKIYC